MHDCTTVEVQVVGIGLYKFCSTAEDRSMAHNFGIGCSTVNDTYREICEAVVAVLDNWLHMMSLSEMPQHAREEPDSAADPASLGERTLMRSTV